VLSAFAEGAVFGERFGAPPLRVLALHGWQRSHGDFAEVLGAGRALDAVALDLPGFGASPPPETAMGSREYAMAIRPVLDEAEGPVVVVGHSFGGRVALHLAALEPERVGRLILVGVPLLRPEAAGGTRPSRRYRMIRRAARLGLLSDQRLERARRRYGSSDYANASGVMREVLVRLLAEDYSLPLRALDQPVELVVGEHDSAAPVEVQRRALAELRHGRLTVVEGRGHLLLTEDPARVRHVIEEVLA
jgi:pimeloyl-ACP methyl ester carboxylesterase